MGWTRTRYELETRNIMDAVGSGRWSSSTIKAHLGLAHKQLWREILDANKMYRFAERTVSPDADGLVPLTSLNSGSGDTLQRFYRVLTDENGYGGVSRGNILYQEGFWERFPNADQQNALSGGLRGTWWIQGNDMKVLPVAGGVVTVSVNHTPASIDELSADAIEAEFPDGYELAVCYRACAPMLAKGGAEDDNSNTMLAISREYMTDLIATISRRSTAPMQVRAADSASNWGR